MPRDAVSRTANVEREKSHTGLSRNLFADAVGLWTLQGLHGRMGASEKMSVGVSIECFVDADKVYIRYI